jgi:catechol 2,3-dioxygenase-like lactoylglutathione lyase family enzyme
MGGIVDLKLELVLVPVADVDRSKAFYTEKAGFNLDVDTEPTPGFRIVQPRSRAQGLRLVRRLRRSRREHVGPTGGPEQVAVRGPRGSFRLLILRVVRDGRRVELESDEGLIPRNPGIVTGLDDVGVAGCSVTLGPVLVIDM